MPNYISRLCKYITKFRSSINFNYVQLKKIFFIYHVITYKYLQKKLKTPMDDG